MKDFEKIKNKVQAAVEKRTKEIDALEVAISHDREALEVARNDMQRGTDTDDLPLYQDARGRVSFYEATIARKDKELEILKKDPLPEADELQKLSEVFRESVLASIAEKKRKAADLVRQMKELDDGIDTEREQANEVSRMVRVDCMKESEIDYHIPFPSRISIFNDIRDAVSLENAAGLLDGTQHRPFGYFVRA